MSIADTVNEQMKVAMRAKDKGRLAALRFIHIPVECWKMMAIALFYVVEF